MIEFRHKEQQKLKEFDKPIPQELLNIVDKKRKNLFAWRGQFSPELIEIFIARNVALDVLEKSISHVSLKNYPYLEDTIEKVGDIGKTKILNPK